MSSFAHIVQVSADFLTSILAVIALWSLLFHRKKINAFARLLAHSVINERINRIKGTLGELDALDFNVKDERREILAVLGELAGMLKGFAKVDAGFKGVFDDIIKITEHEQGVSEPIKRRLCAEIHILLDDHSVTAATEILENSNGSTNNPTP